ncbi:MAG: penicillin-binding protein 2 [Anaerolineae bacterium]|nr:penicillin-binding protein 2 [Anaerolineae bacterium]MDW8100969.1 penicillin-binding protein 2 [Anaerolineae bacterium]
MIAEELPLRLQRRVLIVAIGLTFLLLLLTLQLVRWHVLARSAVLTTEPPYVPAHAVYPPRGNILDRRGELLATDIFRWNIGISPAVVRDKERVAQELASLLGQTAEQILQKVTAEPNAPYILLAANVAQSVGEQVAALNEFGLSADPHPLRYYPRNELAAHVLGFVNAEGRAYYGVEEFYQKFLTGATTLRNLEAIGEPLPAAFRPYIPSPVGRDLVLTLDIGIQYLVENELKFALEYYGAQAGTIIVMDPRTGEILALANQPSFDPNQFAANPESWANSAISGQYEPGSVVKVLTLAAGLDSGAITLEQTFVDNGVLEVGGYVIRNSGRRAYGVITLSDILAYSINVGAAQVSLLMGEDTFYRYLWRFGLGQVTEVDLAGESSGIVKDPKSALWSKSDLATNAYGQGVAITPLQLVTAISAIANDGVAMHPRIVSKLVDHGRVIPVRSRPYPRAIKAETARIMRRLMAEATERGIDAALVPGYKVAGKTGTAQVPTATGYSEDETIVTYVGFLPVDEPRVIVLVKLDRPTRSIWASEVAVPVFQRIAKELVRLLDIPPDKVRLGQS